MMARSVELPMSERRLFVRRRLRAPGSSAQSAARVADVRSILAKAALTKIMIASNGLFGSPSYT
jgi:hypothetical protein